MPLVIFNHQKMGLKLSETLVLICQENGSIFVHFTDQYLMICLVSYQLNNKRKSKWAGKNFD